MDVKKLEETKLELLNLSNELVEKFKTKEYEEGSKTLKELHNKILLLNNKQILKKWEGIINYLDSIENIQEQEIVHVNELIEHLKGSIEKNIQQMIWDIEAFRLEDEAKNQNLTGIDLTISNFKKSIEANDSEEFARCNAQIVKYILKTSTKNRRELNKIHSGILDKYNSKKLQDMTKEEKELLLKEVEKLSEAIHKEDKIDEIPIPTEISEIRKEIDEILGKPLLEGIENEYEFAIKYQLNEKEIDKFQNLRKELQELLIKPEDNNDKIAEIREEMAEILGINPYTYKDNKKIIDSLEEPKKSRFEKLKAKHEEFLNNKKKNKKDEGDKENTPTGLVLSTQKPQKKKNRRLVKFAKSAKKFYQKHKKAILLVTGIVLTAVALHALLPSIMYFNSVLWHNAVINGATQLPAVLHDINLVIGSKIGATYATGSGVWTLANGALLNAGAAQAGLLASLGKVALSAGTIGIGTTIAVKNAYRLAKEKIEKFKNRKKTPKQQEENKENIFTNVKDSFTKGYKKGKRKVKDAFTRGYEKGKTRASEEWNKYRENRKNAETKNNPEDKNTQKNTESGKEKFYRSDISSGINERVNYLIEHNYISDEVKKQLETTDKETFNDMLKNIYHKYEIDFAKKEKVDINRIDNSKLYNYIKYAYETGAYSADDIQKMREMEPSELRKYISDDPKFAEFEEMIEEWSASKENPTLEYEEENRKGSK